MSTTEPPATPGGPSFYDVVLHQRATRLFRPDPVAPEVVRRVLVAATHAPSAENTQPWRFVVVREAAAKQRIGELATALWDAAGKAWAAQRIPEWMLREVDAGARIGIAGAPVVVVVAADPEHVAAPALEASIWPCVQNLLLAAAAEGLGTTLMTMPVLNPREFAEVVGLPADIRPMAAIPLGYPVRRPSPPRRRPLDEVAYAETWGEPLP